MKYCITILFLLIFQFSFSQVKVEDIKDENDISSFLDTYYFKGNRNDTIISYKRFSDSLPIYDSDVIKYFDSIKSPKWIIADFNKDGKQDLVFNGYFNEYATVLAFISEKDNKYTFKKLSLYADEYSPHFIKDFGKNPYLIVGRTNDEKGYWDTSYHFEDRFRIDTLSYQNNLFLDYDLGQIKMKPIDSIKFTYTCFLCINRFTELTITPNRQMKLRKMEPTDTSKDARFTMNDYSLNYDSTQYLFSFIQQIQFSKYLASYRPVQSGWHDGYHWKTEIYFSDRSYKRIFDYMATAPPVLRYVYQKVSHLIKRNDWKFVQVDAQ